MKKRLLLIALMAASFGWGFSALVELSDRGLRDGTAALACADWPNCSPAGTRRQP